MGGTRWSESHLEGMRASLFPRFLFFTESRALTLTPSVKAPHLIESRAPTLTPSVKAANLIYHSYGASNLGTPTWALTTKLFPDAQGTVRVALTRFLCTCCPTSRSTGSSQGSGLGGLRACC